VAVPPTNDDWPHHKMDALKLILVFVYAVKHYLRKEDGSEITRTRASFPNRSCGRTLIANRVEVRFRWATMPRLSMVRPPQVT